MGPDIDINLEPVAQASSDISDIAADAASHVSVVVNRNQPAVAGLAGFHSAAGLEVCAQAWHTHLTGLIQNTLEAAEKLRDTVTDYADLERRLAGSLGSMDSGE